MEIDPVMVENIYTTMLRARRHPVPEGLHAATLTSERLQDVVTKDYALVSQGESAPERTAIVVRSDDGMIA